MLQYGELYFIIASSLLVKYLNQRIKKDNTTNLTSVRVSQMILSDTCLHLDLTPS